MSKTSYLAIVWVFRTSNFFAQKYLSCNVRKIRILKKKFHFRVNITVFIQISPPHNANSWCTRNTNYSLNTKISRCDTVFKCWHQHFNAIESPYPLKNIHLSPCKHTHAQKNKKKRWVGSYLTFKKIMNVTTTLFFLQ